MATDRVVEQLRAGLPALVTAVAAELGSSWTVVQPYCWLLQLRGPLSAALAIAVPPTSVGKIQILGCYPRGAGLLTDLQTVRIGVSASRGPAVVAREISRRVLPLYMPELVRAQQVVHGLSA